MSISATLSSAISGLTASTRASTLVSRNVANAMTDGYARRELALSGAEGGGVKVDGVQRVTDPAATGDRRLSEAELGAAETRRGFHAGMERALGTPDDPASLSAGVNKLESALTSAASRPDLSTRLDAVRRAAETVTDRIRAASSRVQELRGRAEDRISGEIGQINHALGEIHSLNTRIRAHDGGPRDLSTLEDQRQRAIDTVAEVIPVRVYPRNDGRLAVFSTGGAQLVDGPAATFSFRSAPAITPDMSLAGGTLAPLRIDGRPVDAGATGPVAGGRLAALFAQRDELAVTEQARLDSIAGKLVERFSDPAVDPTLTPGHPGLFTDAGGSPPPADTTGLAGRLSVNSSVDPGEGGALWRIRDGIEAAAEGPKGDATRLRAFSAALGNASAASGGPHRPISGMVSDLLSQASTGRVAAEADVAAARTRTDALSELEAVGGVDTDTEMQKLLLIEQAYGANARVLKTADQMIKTLLEF